MAGRVRIISGPRNKAFDSYIRDILDRDAWEQEHTYFGIETQERADEVRRRLRTAGGHMDPPVSVKAYWYECPGKGCPSGDPDCQFHVSFTVYDMDVARAYKKRLAESAGYRQ